MTYAVQIVAVHGNQISVDGIGQGHDGEFTHWRLRCGELDLPITDYRGATRTLIVPEPSPRNRMMPRVGDEGVLYQGSL